MSSERARIEKRRDERKRLEVLTEEWRGISQALPPWEAHEGENGITFHNAYTGEKMLTLHAGAPGVSRFLTAMNGHTGCILAELLWLSYSGGSERIREEMFRLFQSMGLEPQPKYYRPRRRR